MFKKAIVASLLIILGYFPVVVNGQAVTVISSGADAQNCSSIAESTAQFSQFSYVSNEDLEDCNRALESGVLTRRDRAATYVNRGIILGAMERYQEAFTDYHRAMELMPELPESYVGRGNIYFLAGKHEKAIKDYNRALELNIGRDYVAHLNMGMVYENLKDYKHAEENYRRALEIFPDWGIAKNRLERLLNKQNGDS